MQEIAGTTVHRRTFSREETIQCAHWLEFEISEVRMNSIRITYRCLDPALKKRLESQSTREKDPPPKT